MEGKKSGKMTVMEKDAQEDKKVGKLRWPEERARVE
jgi:hypothetical protein